MAPDEPSLVPAIITRDDDPDDDDDNSYPAPGGRVIVDAGALARVLKVLDRR